MAIENERAARRSGLGPDAAAQSFRWLILLAGVVVFGTVGAVGLSRADDPATPPPPPSLDDQLAALHKEARAAREAKQLAEVERLRLERRKLILEAKGASPSKDASLWKKGMTAITQAEQAVAGMQYQRAATILEAAWKPFEALPPRRVVFGDLAMELFLTTEAGRMVDPGFEPVSADVLRKWLERARQDDPCQVEAEAALAFLSRPNPNESFQRQNDRDSIRSRNDRLLAIGRDFEAGGPVLPWHAPVQYLRAKSTSFVLGDVDYLRTFLDPRARLSGTNRHGEAWCLTLGGGILGVSTSRSEGKVRQVVKIDSYDPGRRAWQELHPQVVVVSSAVPDADAGPWQVSWEGVRKRLELLLIDLDAEVRQHADRGLVAIAGKFHPEVQAAVEQIRNRTWKNGPPPGSSIEEVLRVAASEFGTFAANRADQAAAATKARNDIDQLKQDVDFVTRFKTSNAASTAPQLADADRVALMAVIGRIDFSESQPSTPAADALAAAGFGQAAQQKGIRGPQLKAELLDVLARAELLGAVQAYATQGFSRIKNVPVNAENMVAQMEAGGEASSAQRRIVRQLRDAVGRLEPVFAKVTTSPLPPIQLADFSLIRRQLAEVRRCCAALDLAERSEIEAEASPLLAVYDRVVGPVEDRARALRVAAGRAPVRSWTIGAVEWKFFELDVIGPLVAAELVEIFPPLVVAESDLEAVSTRLASGGSPPVPVLRTGSAKGAPLVDASGTSPGLAVGMGPPSSPIVAIVLVERDGSPAADGPRTLRDDEGRPILLLNDAGTDLAMRLDLADGHLVVEYPGFQGNVPLGVTADPGSRPRFIRDRRGYRISAAAADQPRLFDIVAANGERVDGSFHSIADLVDLDRNIVNEFLPPALLYAPSLHVWQAYREQLLRQPPDGRVRWAVPRPAFRADP